MTMHIVRIGDNTHAAAKSLAAMQHITLSELTELALIAYIRAHPATTPAESLEEVRYEVS